VAARAATVSPARAAAFDVLLRVFEDDAYADRALRTAAAGLDERDRALAQRLAYGAVQRVRTLDYAIEELGGRRVARLDAPVRAALRLGAYQLLRTRIGAHAAVSTSVDLVRSRVGHGPVGFVNAILRKISQRDEELWVQELAPPITEDLIGHLAFQYAHPKWIAEVFNDALSAVDISPSKREARQGKSLYRRVFRSRRR